mgnify:CR=1 FL=1
MKKQLNEQEIKISSMGSIAEASFKLNGVFEAAQKAADDYVNEARQRAERIVERARLEAELFNETSIMEPKSQT